MELKTTIHYTYRSSVRAPIRIATCRLLPRRSSVAADHQPPQHISRSGMRQRPVTSRARRPLTSCLQRSSNFQRTHVPGFLAQKLWWRAFTTELGAQGCPRYREHEYCAMQEVLPCLP